MGICKAMNTYNGGTGERRAALSPRALPRAPRAAARPEGFDPHRGSSRLSLGASLEKRGRFAYACLTYVHGSGAVGDGSHLILQFQNLRSYP